MRRATALLAALALGGGVALAAQAPDDGDGDGASAPQTTASPLPGPDVAIPRAPRELAAELTATTRRLRAAIEAWRTDGDPSAGGPPRDVTYLALHHQRMLRVMATERRLGDRTLRLLPADVRGEARDTVRGRRALARIPRAPGARTPPVRTAPAEPADVLRAAYVAAERRFGVSRHVLASVNFVESAFGKVRSASSAGARGPMQFLPATWRAYGMGGDVHDARDAILGAANLLRRAGAPRRIRRALFAYNHSTAYVDAILHFAGRMRRDERAFYAYYSWQVYARTATGVRRLTGPGR